MAFQHDMIGRETVVKDLMKTIRLVHDTKHGFTLCLNGSWGCGKTYILNELEERLKAETASATQGVTGANKYLVLHYNCWQYDYYEEPLAAIVSVFMEELQRILDPVTDSAYDKADTILQSALSLIIGVMLHLTAKEFQFPKELAESLKEVKESGKDIAEVMKLFPADRRVYVDHLAPFSAAIRETSKVLDTITSTDAQDTNTDRRGYTIVLVVDELDRCLPSYAIKVLERLHHLFDQRENCAVILALDKPQLAHAIRTCFGPRTDVNVYLKKFIHYTYNLYDKRSREGVFMEKYASYFNLFRMTPEAFISCKYKDYLIALFANLDMRTQELLFLQAEMLHRHIFPDLHHAPAELLLVEITATVFSHYEITHSRECKWDRLMCFPFEVVDVPDSDKGRLKPIYKDMHSLEIHIKGNWPDLKLKSGEWTFGSFKGFPKTLAAAFAGSLEGQGVEMPNLNCGKPSSQHMTTFIKNLRQCW